MKVRKGSKLFRRYLLSMFSMVMVSLMLMCILFLGIETSHWKKEQTETLSSYTNVIAGNVRNLMHNYHDSTLSNTIPVYILANNLNTMCTANNCDIFICDLNGKVILCREMTNGDIRNKKQT